jgi:hypothetical protein
VLVVLCSIVISFGLGAMLGIQVTPIITEVIPFVILAIGASTSLTVVVIACFVLCCVVLCE